MSHNIIMSANRQPFKQFQIFGTIREKIMQHGHTQRFAKPPGPWQQNHFGAITHDISAKHGLIYKTLENTTDKKQQAELKKQIKQDEKKAKKLREDAAHEGTRAKSQKRIVAKVDELMALCDELEKRREKQEQMRVKLNKAALHALVSSKTTDAFSQNWRRICDHFPMLYDRPQNVAELRQAILQLAVMGKLVPQDPSDEPASVLLERVLADRSNFLKEGLATKVRLPKSIQENTILIPTSWEHARFGEILSFGPRNGFSPKGVEYETNVKVLSLGAITRGFFDPHKFKFADITVPFDSHLWLNTGDILLQRANSLEYVGVSAVFTGESANYIYPDLIMKCRVVAGLIPQFIHLALSSDISRNYFRNNASGTSGSMPKINQGVVQNLWVPIPP